MIEILPFMVGGLLLFFLALYLITVMGKHNESYIEELEEEEEETRQRIEKLTIELNHLQQSKDSYTMNKQTKLTENTITALNVYEESNIRIPLDIIEELTHIRLHDEVETFNYIENQRNYWKLENTKKPYKKVTR